MSITLSLAQELSNAALEEGRRQDLPPLAVAVFDARGVLRSLVAEDGVELLRPDIAIGKAWSVVGMGRSTRQMMHRAEEVPAFFVALTELAHGRIVPVPGGLPLRDTAGALIGGIGVSGATADEDEACAAAAARRCGLSPDT